MEETPLRTKSDKEDLEAYYVAKECIIANLEADYLAKECIIANLEEVLIKGRTRLDHMKADFRREEIKRQIKTLTLIHDCKVDIANAEHAESTQNLTMEAEHTAYEDIGDKVRQAVDERTSMLDKIEKYKHNIFKLEIESDITAVGFRAGSYDDTFAFLEVGSGEIEPSGTSHTEILAVMNKFEKFIDGEIWRFHKAPLGPLYSSVNVKDKRWGALVERILRPYLFAYIVHSEFDQYVLDGLIKEFMEKYCSNDLDSTIPAPTVFVIDFETEFHPLENKVTGVDGMPECECVNLFDAIQFQNKKTEVWKTFLSNVVNAEKIVLFKTEHDAFVLMHNQARASLENQLVLMAYSLDGFKIHPFPNFRTSVIKLPVHAQYMRINLDDKIVVMKEKLHRFEEEYIEMTSEIESYRKEQFGALDKFTNAKESLRNLSLEKRDLKIRLQRLNAALKANFTIEGETLKVNRLALKLEKFAEEQCDRKFQISKKKTRLEKLGTAKEGFEEDLICMQKEGSVLQKQIKMHRETNAGMKKNIRKTMNMIKNDLAEVNGNDIAYKDLNSNGQEDLNGNSNSYKDLNGPNVAGSVDATNLDGSS